MASSSGASTGSTGIQEVMDLRKRRRMQSNRESARRSRQRKQKLLDDLNARASWLREENGRILAVLNVTTRHHLGVEAENAVLRARMTELSHRLESLNEILSCVNGVVDEGMRPWSSVGMSDQPVMASLDTFQYC